MSNRATSQLSGDHQLILQSLEVLREISGRLARQETVDRNDLRLLLEFFREFVHSYHDGKEHLILIPALIEAGESLYAEPLSRIVSDHHEIHALMAELETAVLTGNDGLVANLADRYIKALSDHLFTEDRFMFDAMAKVLNDVTDFKVWKKFNEFEPGLREKSKAKFETVVKNIGRKYASPLSI